jgi:hypothetical protein
MRPYLEKNPSQKRAGGVAQGVGPEFKSQYCKKKKKRQEDPFCSLVTIPTMIPSTKESRDRKHLVRKFDLERYFKWSLTLKYN